MTDIQTQHWLEFLDEHSCSLSIRRGELILRVQIDFQCLGYLCWEEHKFIFGACGLRNVLCDIGRAAACPTMRFSHYQAALVTLWLREVCAEIGVS